MIDTDVARSLRRQGILPKTDLLTRIGETKELKGKPFDLLLSDGWLMNSLRNASYGELKNLPETLKNRSERLKNACLKRGMSLENVGIVHADVEMDNYKFAGDELNPKNALVIVNKSIQYGRKFNEICWELESKGRKFGYDSVPPTFAFFNYAASEENGELIGFSTLIPIHGSIFMDSIYADMNKKEYGCGWGHDFEKGQNHYSYIVTDKTTGEKRHFSWVSHPLSDRSRRVHYRVNNNESLRYVRRR